MPKAALHEMTVSKYVAPFQQGLHLYPITAKIWALIHGLYQRMAVAVASKWDCTSFTRIGTGRVESVDSTRSRVSQPLLQLPDLKKGLFSQKLGVFPLPDALLGPTDEATSPHNSQIVVVVKTFTHRNTHILPLAHKIKLSMQSLF